jgi:glycosyltransferase involved in cell wall biosynthesis
VHTPALADELRDEVPRARVESIRLGHGVASAIGPEARARVRAALGISEHAVVFGVFGGLTPEKRVPQILDAFRALLPYCPDAHLLLAGAPASHYDLHANVGSDLIRHVTMTGYIIDDRALTETLAAADVALNLRWPTAREMSGPWLRALAAGVATVTIDLAHTAHIPSLDSRTWQPNEPAGPPPVTVAIDILDEDHSLRRAMRRLASDPALRATLAAAGREFWEREHSVERMLDDYRRVLPIAAATPAPAPVLPPHMVTDGDRVLRGLLQDFGGVQSAVRIWGTLGLGVEKA